MKRASILLVVVCCTSFTACDDESSQIEPEGEQDSEGTAANDTSASTENSDETTTDTTTPTERESSSDTNQLDSEVIDQGTDTHTGLDEENTDRDTHTDDAVDTETEADSATIDEVDTDAGKDTSGSGSEPPCHGVSRDGCCRGNVVYWCWTDGENDHLGEQDCGGYDCGWSDKIAMFKCKLGGGDPVPDGMTAVCPGTLP